MYCYLDRGCEEDKIKSQHYRRIERIQGSFIIFYKSGCEEGNENRISQTG